MDIPVYLESFGTGNVRDWCPIPACHDTGRRTTACCSQSSSLVPMSMVVAGAVMVGTVMTGTTTASIVLGAVDSLYLG